MTLDPVLTSPPSLSSPLAASHPPTPDGIIPRLGLAQCHPSHHWPSSMGAAISSGKLGNLPYEPQQTTETIRYPSALTRASYPSLARALDGSPSTASPRTSSNSRTLLWHAVRGTGPRPHSLRRGLYHSQLPRPRYVPGPVSQAGERGVLSIRHSLPTNQSKTHFAVHQTSDSCMLFRLGACRIGES